MSSEHNINNILSAASFDQPIWIKPSAWLQHAPFIFHLISKLKPQNFVELGTHYGFSFFCVCQTVKKYNLKTKCYAIDTWQGDEHAGFYDDIVFDEVSRHLIENYSNFATLKRSTFVSALEHFPDQSIDLLHIDGRHLYEDVKEDFISWLPKLSKNAVVLFHDTQVKEGNFGVYKFFEQLKYMRPWFEFEHGYGLGIIPTGDIVPEMINSLLNLNNNSKLQDSIKNIYHLLGQNIQMVK